MRNQSRQSRNASSDMNWNVNPAAATKNTRAPSCSASAGKPPMCDVDMKSEWRLGSRGSVQCRAICVTQRKAQPSPRRIWNLVTMTRRDHQLGLHPEIHRAPAKPLKNSIVNKSILSDLCHHVPKDALPPTSHRRDLTPVGNGCPLKS